MAANERVTGTRTYRGFTILTVKQDNGRVTYDIRRPDGSPDSWGHEYLAVAKAEIDAGMGEL